MPRSDPFWKNRWAALTFEEKKKLAVTSDWETVLQLAAETPRLLYYRTAAFAKQNRLDEAEQAAVKFREFAQTARTAVKFIYTTRPAHSVCAPRLSRLKTPS